MKNLKEKKNNTHKSYTKNFFSFSQNTNILGHISKWAPLEEGRWEWRWRIKEKNVRDPPWISNNEHNLNTNHSNLCTWNLKRENKTTASFQTNIQYLKVWKLNRKYESQSSENWNELNIIPDKNTVLSFECALGVHLSISLGGGGWQGNSYANIWK